MFIKRYIGHLPNKYYIIGDEAFTCSNQLLTPYSGRNLGAWKDSYNYHISLMRQCIERSFSLLTQRWGILWRPLKCRFSRWTSLLTACAKLHNYCINADIPISTQRYDEDVEDDDFPEVIMNDGERNEDVITNFVANRRTVFTRELQLKGIRRPNHAMVNSRA